MYTFLTYFIHLMLRIKEHHKSRENRATKAFVKLPSVSSNLLPFSPYLIVFQPHLPPLAVSQTHKAYYCLQDFVLDYPSVMLSNHPASGIESP